jgi:hypothetical protein
MNDVNKERKATTREERMDYLNELIRKADEETALRSWAELTDSVTVWPEVYAALMTGRPQLLESLRPRALSVSECEVLFGLIKTLVKTNHALQTHAQQLSRMVANWSGAFTQLHSTGQDIVNFASFKRVGERD